jgi:PAS domain S-box-containing protein
MTDVTKIDAFIQSSPHPAWLATSRGECLYVNPALEHLVGLKSDEINKVDWRSFLLEEDRSAASASWQRSLASGTAYRTTVRLRGIDGVSATVELIAFGHTISEGTELWLFTGLYMQGAAQQYPRLEAQLQATLNLIPAYAWYALPSGALTFVNERTADYLGLPKDHPLRFGIDTGAEWDAHVPLLHPDDQEEARRVWSVCLSTGSAGENSQQVRNAKGEYRWFLSRAEPVRASDGTLLYWIGMNLDIDERKRAELQLAKSAQELQRSDFYLTEAQRLGHLGSWIFDPAKGFEYWSDELFRIYDLDPAKGPPNAEQYLEAVHPQDREFMDSLMRRMLSDDFGFDVTKRIVRASGEVRYVRCVGTMDSDSAPSKRIGVGIDVTDHEVLTQELRRREAYLAEAQRLSRTGSFGWTPGSGEIRFSEETFRIYEYDPTGNVTLGRIIEQIHPDDRDLVLETAGRASRTGAAIDFTHRLLSADGRVKYLHVLAKRLQSASDEVEFAGAVIDITEAKRAEETIRKSEKELRTLVEAIPAYVGTAQPDGSVDFISQSFLDYTGFSREQGMGWGWGDAIHPEDLDRVSANWRAALATGSPIEHELRYRSADGTYHWFLYRGLPLRDDGGNAIKWYGTVTNIDALKETQHALQMREHELVGIIEAIPSMLWSASPTGETTYLSQRCREYCGAPLEELVSRGWENFIHPNDLQETTKVFARAISSGESYSALHRLRRADGEYRWHHALGEPLRDHQGTIIQWYGLTIDIDQRKRAEERIRLNEKELHTLVETIPAFVGTALPDGSCDFLSESWLNYLGFTREQGLGWGWADAIHPEDVDRVVASWRAGLAAREPVEQELRCRSADGTYHWFLNRDSPLIDNEGNVIKWYGTLTNIDAMKETEHALQMREHELLGIIDTIPSMLWSTSPTGESTHLSQRFREYWGVSFEEIANRGWTQLIHPDDREDTTNAFFRAIETGNSFNTIQRLRRADGEYRWHHSMGEPLRDADCKIIQWYGLSIDIDERKRAEDHLRDTRVKLAKASRLATVAELAASIAHELNQPLMSILANAQAANRWLIAAPPNVTEVNSSIERIIRDAHAADETMQHIRALFKQESSDKNDVNIPDIIREVIRVVQEDPKKRVVPIECDFEESLPLIHVDQIQIQQVFINLIVNALEALEGQQVTPLIVLRAVTDSNGMLIQVIDNGPGVDDPDRIFDAFMTTKENGMGIGLAVSRSTVEAHGGQLWAENNKTGGATFNVALPLTHTSRATLQTRESA